MAGITKELAEKIARKLNADIHKGKRHDIAKIFHGGKMVASFGIRRGSRRDQGHNYISGQIFVSQPQAKMLGECPLSRDEWIQILREKGKI